MTVAAARAVLAAGGVVAIPTDTVYGLAVDPRQPGATAALFAVKGRPDTSALPVLVARAEEAAELAVFGPAATELAKAFWPGPLTIVVPRNQASAGWPLGGDAGTIGLRCPANDLARSLLGETGPLAVSSANRHGEPPCHTAAAVRETLGDELTILDGGTCSGQPSSVVAVLDGTVEILRQGPISLEQIGATVAGVSGRSELGRSEAAASEG